MKQIQYKNVKYEVPTSWDEVPIKTLIELNEDSDLFKTDTTKKLAFISAFCKIPVEVIKKSKVGEVKKLFKYLDFMSEPLPESPIFEFEFKGEKYSVMQSLMDQEFQDFVSMETCIADSEGKTYRALPMMLAIMCKRPLESMDDYDLMERAKLFEDLPVTIAQPLSVFFYQKEQMSTILSLVSSNQQEVIQMKREEVLDTLKKRDGMGLLTRWLSGILAFWVRYTIPEHRKSYTSTPQS